ncbi:MAG: AAA family ATPase [Faecalibacterium prausnitzii]
MKEMNIPVGVSDFEEIRKNGYYYIDKSGLIGELLSRTGTKVTLITRPRRFGKTLGMSMLESFFDIRKDSRKRCLRDWKSQKIKYCAMRG